MTFSVFKLLCKVYESASSCEFTTIAGPPTAKKVLNSRKAKRKLKKIYSKVGN